MTSGKEAIERESEREKIEQVLKKIALNRDFVYPSRQQRRMTVRRGKGVAAAF